MKKFLLPLVLTVALFAITGCSEKFNIAAPYKNITVVYGLLDMADTAHYIRIQKAFLDQSKNALVMAKDSDSSFYSHLNVCMKRFTFDDTIHWKDTIHLVRVDLNAEGYPKQPGVFFNTPNYAYKFTNLLDREYLYRIVITNLTTGEVDSSTTPVIDDLVTTIRPVSFYVDALDPVNKIKLGFYATINNKYFEMDGSYQAPFDFSFRGYTSPISIAQAIVRFNWDDSNTITNVHTPQYYDYAAPMINLGVTGLVFKLYNTQLYGALNAGMGVAPANTVRLLSRCDVSVYVSTPDFSNYLQTSLTQGTGLTGTEIEPIYTNVAGNAVGLFTARGMRTAKITIDDQTVDSLIVSPLLQQARIVGTVYH